MAMIGEALRQAFMPKHEYERLREEEKAWMKLERGVVVCFVAVISVAVVVCGVVSLRMVFPGESGKRPFCKHHPPDSDLFPTAFYFTDQQTVDYYYMVVFFPSLLLFFVSLSYLLAGMAVAYSAPARHGCLKLVENNYCASRRGGVRCLSILNVVFAILFGLLAVFLGSSLLTLGSSCSLPLFWCYEIATWGLVILYAGTAFFLRRKAAMILDESEFSGRNLGLEMLEANALEVSPEMERRVNEGFKEWMGSSILSSDDEDEPDSYMGSPQQTQTVSNR